MKILFMASIQGKDKYIENYKKIVDVLKNAKHKVIADHVLSYGQEELDDWDNEKKVKFHKNIMDKIKGVDVVVAEISYPSISVGYLVSLALDSGKPTVVLYSGTKEPNILSTMESTDKLQLLKYKSLTDIRRYLLREVEDAKDQMDVRFNFFVSPKIVRFLDWIAKKRKMPRAVYLRRLIEADMKKNKDYLKGA